MDIILKTELRDPVTGLQCKRTRRRLRAKEVEYLEQEYLRLSKYQTEYVFNKRELKRIAKELNFEASKVYKWCWERNKRDLIEQSLSDKNK